MKALVLAAGYGTRLLPYSAHTPKPLFTLNRRPLLDIIIRRLLAAGADTIIVNTHHRHDQIADFLSRQDYAPSIVTRHEPDILGTGGAIRNTADIWQGQPLLVVNSDIYTDIDFKAFARFHADHGQPASLVLCHDPDFNSVAVDGNGRIAGFRGRSSQGSEKGFRLMTFTGIQIIADTILDYLPSGGFAHSIDAYQAMIADGHALCAWVPSDFQWSDLGTPDRYRCVARNLMARKALLRREEAMPEGAVEWQPLPGDGSDRQWYRLRAGQTRMIVADHGIKPSLATCEAEAFVAIGHHLKAMGLPVPRIYLEDAFAGLVFMEDLGSQNLQARVLASPHLSSIQNDYGRLIDILLDMSFAGGNQFNPDWTWQTRRYDHSVVLTAECRYFTEAFLGGYLGLRMPYETLAHEYRHLADTIATIRPLGFMHRDFQSRNIMVRDNRFYLIDFQGGRIGPPHYDLASLLIDPYVNLPVTLRETLLTYFCDQLAARAGIASSDARHAYRYCALSRNLQILGAYGFLSRQKGKPSFERYIPPAAMSLQHNLSYFPPDVFPLLTEMAARTIPRHLPSP